MNKDDMRYTANKMHIKKLNGMDTTKETMEYIEELMSSRTNDDWEQIDRADKMARDYINTHISKLSDIPLGRISQYIDLLSKFEDEQLYDMDIQEVILYVAMEVSKDLDNVVPDWSKDWKQESSEQDFVEKYKRLINDITKSELCSAGWKQNMAELIYTCYNMPV